MSRQGFKDFVHALEHSSSLRRQLHQLPSIDAVVALARDNGFAVSESDFQDDARCYRVARWFANSWIS